MVAPTPTGRPCPRPDKRKFLEPGRALTHLAETFTKVPPRDRPHPYECVCGYWHLGRGPVRRDTVGPDKYR